MGIFTLKYKTVIAEKYYIIMYKYNLLAVIHMFTFNPQFTNIQITVLMCMLMCFPFHDYLQYVHIVIYALFKNHHR